MTLQLAPSRPIRWSNPTPAELARWAKECLESDGTPILSAHAGRDRLNQRGFTHDDVVRAIRYGHAYKMDPGARKGEWKVNLSVKMPNGRDAAVVCLVGPQTREVVVLTVMWVDPTCKLH